MNANTVVEEVLQKWRPLTNLRRRLLVEDKYKMGCIPYWHYAVALSDDWAISWGLDKKSSELTIHSLGKLNYRESNFDSDIDDDDILKNIVTSCFLVHGKIDYILTEFNCEHWARLVTGGRTKCSQTGYRNDKFMPVFERAKHQFSSIVDRLIDKNQ